MAEDRNILIEDAEGNRYFPHTKDTNVFNASGQSVASQLADKATKEEIQDVDSKVKSSVLYNSALDDMRVNYNLINCKQAIKLGKLRVAVVGDSIAEGSNNLSQDVWVDRFVNQLKRDLPEVVIEFTNFSLGGRTMSQFNDANYKAVNPETNIATNYWRPWATVGKSWKDHVKDYAADLTILAFGMNEAQLIKAGYWYYTNLNNAISYVKTSDMDIALVSTILPTQNKQVYGQSEQETQNVARITREYAINNNYALIDCNRLWRILLYGIEECNFTNKESYSIPDINNLITYNFEANIVFTSTNYPPSSSSCDMQFRKNENNTEFTLLRFRNDGDGNKVDLYLVVSDGVIFEANLVKTWSAGQSVSIRAVGSKIAVNGDEFTVYEKLYDSTLDLLIQPYISSIHFIQRVNFAESPTYKEVELLGVVTDPIGQGFNGNGINHPNSAGHYLTYYMAGLAIVDSMVAESSAIINFPYVDFRNPTMAEGEYSIYSDTVLNPPVTGTVSGRVSVKNNGMNLWIEFMPWNSTEVYRLNYNSAVWTSWFKFSGVAV